MSASVLIFGAGWIVGYTDVAISPMLFVRIFGSTLLARFPIETAWFVFDWFDGIFQQFRHAIAVMFADRACVANDGIGIRGKFVNNTLQPLYFVMCGNDQ